MDKKALSIAFAKSFVARAKNLGMKGKKRDEIALEFYLGGAAALEAYGVPVADNILLLNATFGVAPRGYAWVEGAAFAAEKAAEMAAAAEKVKDLGKPL